ncbi:amino acid permease [Marinicrinis sediminis]|uniref:Amino acid permease n=1 Tax=Marinicrinis sediminis TaxID=1652465 RepID=A0ABW5RCH7_9BACL
MALKAFVAARRQVQKQQEGDSKGLAWWQLTLLGIGCTIGTGYFLAPAIAIQKAGPSVLLAFVLAAVGTYFVYDALAAMTAAHPEKGSFRSYAKHAYGRWAGFSNGWVYWASEMLITGSQLTALSIFSRFWFPGMPIWSFAAIYAVLGIGVLLLGVKGFERMENGFAVVKIAAIVMFILIASAAWFGWLDTSSQSVQEVMSDWLPKGILGLWGAFMYAFYAFGGIEIMGLLAVELKDRSEASKSGKVMILALIVIYLVTFSLALLLVKWDQFNTKKSPFITALDGTHITFIPHVFNGVLIIAGFSTMLASLYAVTNMLVTLAEEGDAPKVFAKKSRRNLAYPALWLTAGGMLVSITASLLLPSNIFEYMTTAAGLMLLYTWFFILLSACKLIRNGAWGKIKIGLGGLLIITAISGTSLDSTSRAGLWVSLLFLALIAIVTIFMHLKWRKQAPKPS